LTSLTNKGQLLFNGTGYGLVAVMLATRFHPRIGPITRTDRKNKYKFDLRDVWADRTTKYVGITISGFSNTFFSDFP
jgi:hypothetical protein